MNMQTIPGVTFPMTIFLIKISYCAYFLFFSRPTPGGENFEWWIYPV